MSTFAAVIVVLWVPLTFPMVVATRSTALGFAAGPLAFAITCAIAGCFAMLVGTSLLPWEFAIVATANLGAVVWLRRTRSGSRWKLRPGWGVAAVGLAATIPLAIALNRFAVDWDARVVWFGHARWFYVGGDFARTAVRHSRIWGIQNDYPILVPTTIGSMWRTLGRIDVRAAQLAVGILNGCAVFLLGWSVRDLYADRYPKVSTLAACAVCLAVYGFSGPFSSNGYADVLWSVSIATAAVLLLVAPVSTTRIVLGAVLLWVGALTKTEGWTASLLVAALAMWRHRGFVRQHLWILLAFPILSVWTFTARAAHATVRFNFALVKPMLLGNHGPWQRAAPSLHAIFDQAPGLFALALLVLVIPLVGRHTTRAWKAPPPLFALAAFGILLLLLVSLMIDLGSLPGLIATTVDRTTISLKLFALLEILMASFIAADLMRKEILGLEDAPNRPDASPEPTSEHSGGDDGTRTHDPLLAK